MLSFIEIIRIAEEARASDIFIVAGQPISYKKNKQIVKMNEEKLIPYTTEELIKEAYKIANRENTLLLNTGDDDFAISISGLARLRINVYRQRNSCAAVVRIISFSIPEYQSIGIPEHVMSTAYIQKGLVLVTGAAGSGKSTTLACIIDRINKTRSGHVITLEEPIEFLYRNDQCIVSQREVNIDTVDYLKGLRAALRQAPDVILLGEMRDYETIHVALTAAETGHLVLSTLHTLGAVNTIDRIIDIFPANQQQQIRIQLAMLLRKVISQQLVSTMDNEVVPVFEVINVNPAIRTMIREAKVHQIDSVINMSQEVGMVGMDNSLLELYRSRRISVETALSCSLAPDMMQKRLDATR